MTDKRNLAGRNAIVTGSTSGIGLGIAASLAGAGANVMLNGFGDVSEIDDIRMNLADTYRVMIEFSDATCPNRTTSRISLTSQPPASKKSTL
jgi:3-hydroxybutyrate dehydrogenase